MNRVCPHIERKQLRTHPLQRIEVGNAEPLGHPIGAPDNRLGQHAVGAGKPPSDASMRKSERPRISSSASQTYSPNTPIATRLVPPTNKTTIISELQPSTGAPRK